MIVYHQEGQGVRRLHLGLFSHRQFDAFERQWRDNHAPQTVRWCLDDLSGIWVDTHAVTAWQDMVVHITRWMPPKKSFRHAVLLPSALAHHWSDSNPGRCLARHITVLACPAKARSWVQSVR